MPNGTTTIRLLDQDWPVNLPDFAARDEMLEAAREASDAQSPSVLRVCAALVALCSPVGRELRVDYVKARCNPLVYGGAAYSRLLERGATSEQIVAAAGVILPLLRTSRFPTVPEVAETVDFSPAAEDGPIERPSSFP